MADWHKITAADWVNLTYQVADPQLASGLMMMMMHCLNEGGLPDNNEEISDITRLPLETILAIRELRCVKRVTETRDGRLFFNVVSEMLAERTEFSIKQSRRRRGLPPESTEVSRIPDESEINHGQPRSTTVNHGQPIQSVSHAVSQTGNRACARDSAPDAVPAGDQNGQKASEEFRDSLERLVRNRTGTLHNGNGNIEKRVNGEVAALVESGATLAEIEMFDHSRRKAVTLGFYAQNFLKWRADQALSPPEIVKSPKYEDFTGRGAAMIAAARKGKPDGNE